MDHSRGGDPSKIIRISDVKVDPAADDLLGSAAMEPYMNIALAVMGGTDSGPAMEAIAALPLEERYLWRVASALKWAFVDLETLNVEADRQTLSLEDQQKLVELLNLRPLQFCLFLGALLGEKQMERMMMSAIKNSRSVADLTQSD